MRAAGGDYAGDLLSCRLRRSTSDLRSVIETDASYNANSVIVPQEMYLIDHGFVLDELGALCELQRRHALGEAFGCGRDRRDDRCLAIPAQGVLKDHERGMLWAVNLQQVGELRITIVDVSGL